jgi:hypothetical protein
MCNSITISVQERKKGQGIYQGLTTFIYQPCNCTLWHKRQVFKFFPRQGKQNGWDPDPKESLCYLK